jgi:hypothetical protein
LQAVQVASTAAEVPCTVTQHLVEVQLTFELVEPAFPTEKSLQVEEAVETPNVRSPVRAAEDSPLADMATKGHARHRMLLRGLALRAPEEVQANTHLLRMWLLQVSWRWGAVAVAKEAPVEAVVTTAVVVLAEEAVGAVRAIHFSPMQSILLR